MKTLLITQDKSNHVIYGYISSFIAGASYTLLTGSLFNPIWLVVIAAIVGICKEGYDYYLNVKAEKAGLPRPHEVSAYDVLATILGGISLYLPVLFW